MNEGKYVFAQIASYIPRFQFDRIVDKYRGNYRAHELTCYNQFLHLLFGHLLRLRFDVGKIKALSEILVDMSDGKVYLLNTDIGTVKQFKHSAVLLRGFGKRLSDLLLQ